MQGIGGGTSFLPCASLFKHRHLHTALGFGAGPDDSQCRVRWSGLYGSDTLGRGRVHGQGEAFNTHIMYLLDILHARSITVKY